MVVTPPRVGQRAVTRETVDRRALAAFNAAQIAADPGTVENSANGFANEPHNTARYRTSQDRMVVGEMPNQSTRLGYGTAREHEKIIELENRCTGNRTVGSKSHLSAIIYCSSKIWCGPGRRQTWH